MFLLQALLRELPAHVAALCTRTTFDGDVFFVVRSLLTTRSILMTPGEARGQEPRAGARGSDGTGERIGNGRRVAHVRSASAAGGGASASAHDTSSLSGLSPRIARSRSRSLPRTHAEEGEDTVDVGAAADVAAAVDAQEQRVEGGKQAHDDLGRAVHREVAGNSVGGASMLLLHVEPVLSSCCGGSGNGGDGDEQGGNGDAENSSSSSSTSPPRHGIRVTVRSTSSYDFHSVEMDTAGQVLSVGMGDGARGWLHVHARLTTTVDAFPAAEAPDTVVGERTAALAATVTAARAKDAKGACAAGTAATAAAARQESGAKDEAAAAAAAAAANKAGIIQ